MATHLFVIIASGLDAEDSYEDRLFDAGCDDATVAWQKGAMILEFDREATSFSQAVASACHDVRSAGAIVERVEPDHLVSLSDIAERAGITRQAAALYSTGERGRGFPHPVARVTSKTPLWDWVDVATWLHDHGRLSEETVTEARVVRAANLLMERGSASPDALTGELERVRA